MAAITGKVVDARNKQPVPDVHVMFTDKEGKYLSKNPMGTITDQNGEFFFHTLGGAYITFTHVGYKPVIKAVDMTEFGSGGNYSQNIKVNFVPNGYSLPMVEIIDKAKNVYVENKAMLPYAAALLAAGLIVPKVLHKKKKPTRRKQTGTAKKRSITEKPLR